MREADEKNWILFSLWKVMVVVESVKVMFSDFGILLVVC